MRLLRKLYEESDPYGLLLISRAEMKKKAYLTQKEFEIGFNSLKECNLIQSVRKGVYELPPEKHALIEHLLYLYDMPLKRSRGVHISEEANRIFQQLHRRN